MNPTHLFPVSIYYEDTDITGLVYHPNYFKYFERARSELIGGQLLRQAQRNEGLAVAVYRADIVFKKGAFLGDRLEIHSQAKTEGDYRVVFYQHVQREGSPIVLVSATVELVCIKEERLSPIPTWVKEKIRPYYYEAPTLPLKKVGS